MSLNEEIQFDFFFSLSPIKFKRIWTLLLSTILLIVYLLVYFLTDNKAVILTFALIYAVDILLIWAVFITELVNPSKIRKLSLIRLVIIFFLTVLMWTVLHSTLLQFISDVYDGVPSTSSKIQFFGYSMFLSIETIASLGSGAIFANNNNAWGYILIALNTMHGLTFITFAVSKVITIISEKRKKPKKLKALKKI